MEELINNILVFIGIGMFSYGLAIWTLTLLFILFHKNQHKHDL
jgi:hypothetical protein